MLDFLLWGFDLFFWWVWFMRWFVEQFVKCGNAFLSSGHPNVLVRRRKKSRSMSSDSEEDSDDNSCDDNSCDSVPDVDSSDDSDTNSF